MGGRFKKAIHENQKIYNKYDNQTDL